MKVYSRTSWGASKPRRARERVDWTGKILMVHHTAVPFKYASANRSKRIAQEKAHMRQLQQIAFNRGFSDISYNHVVFPSGRKYEGRGFQIKGAHTQGGKPGYEAFYNDHPGVSFTGNYENQKMTLLQRAAFWEYRRYLRNRFSISVKTWPHRKVFATSCPGKNVMSQLKLKG